MDFYINNHVLEAYNGNEEKVIIPEGVTVIGEYAFCEKMFLRSFFRTR